MNAIQRIAKTYFDGIDNSRTQKEPKTMDEHRVKAYTILNDHMGNFVIRSFDEITGDDVFRGTVPATCVITGSSDSDSIAYEVCAELGLGEPVDICHECDIIHFHVILSDQAEGGE